MELFLQYGPEWIGDSSTLVDDSDLEGGGEQRDIVKLRIQGWV